MTRTVVFDSPFLLGFDEMRGLIERVGRHHDSYPPYNVEALDNGHVRISIAVAGFSVAHLRIEVRGAHLTVSASRDKPEGGGRDYLHHGIAMRGFVRAFVLGDALEVGSAVLAHGLLHIDLVRPPMSDAVKVIPISVSG